MGLCLGIELVVPSRSGDILQGIFLDLLGFFGIYKGYFQDFQGSLRILSDFLGFFGDSLRFSGILWDFMGFSRDIMGFLGILSVFWDFQGF